VEKDLERRDFRRMARCPFHIGRGRIDLDGRRHPVRRLLQSSTDFPDDLPASSGRHGSLRSSDSGSIRQSTCAKDVDLSGLSVERVTEELFKILLNSAKPSVGLEELLKVGALEKLFPELFAMALCIQDAIFHPETDPFGHHTVWAHTLLSVDQARSLALAVGLAGRDPGPAPRGPLP
jgi:tRNA nucleotidyltransferase (CCA-adding enzyme)